MPKRGASPNRRLLRDGRVPAVDEVEAERGVVADVLAAPHRRPPAVVVPQLREASPIGRVLAEERVAVLPLDEVDEDAAHDAPRLLEQLLVGVERLRVPGRQLPADPVVLQQQQLQDHVGLVDPVHQAVVGDPRDPPPLELADRVRDLLAVAVERLEIQVAGVQVDPGLLRAAGGVAPGGRPEELVDSDVGEPAGQGVDAPGGRAEGDPHLQVLLHLVGVGQAIRGEGEGLVAGVAAPALAEERVAAVVSAAVDGAVLPGVRRERGLLRRDVVGKRHDVGDVLILVVHVLRGRRQEDRGGQDAGLDLDHPSETAEPSETGLLDLVLDDRQRVDVADLGGQEAPAIAAAGEAAGGAVLAHEGDQEDRPGHGPAKADPAERGQQAAHVRHGALDAVARLRAAVHDLLDACTCVCMCVYLYLSLSLSIYIYIYT